MYKPVTSQNLALFFSLAPMLLSAPSFAQQNDIYTTQNGHAIVQDVEKPGTRIEFDEDQDESTAPYKKATFVPSLSFTRPSKMTFMVASSKSNLKKMTMNGFTN